METSDKRINPLSRRPRGRRLVLAVRGAAGTGKSVFAATLAEAGLGRLCYFDVERKARLLPGSDGAVFDAIEIEHPDELPEFINWALDGEGRAQGYGCYVLDSWAIYFGRKHRETVQAVRERTGDPTALPAAEELAADQMIFQEVLRRLCIDSGACVVITDQIAAKGKEEREENELGRVLPMTTGGLEYFVDVMVELSVRVEDFRQVRVARVVKSNSPAFPIGLELVDPTFADFLDRLGENQAAPAAPEVPALLEVEAPVAAPAGPGLADLLAKAEEHGLTHADLLVAARHYCGVAELQRLSPAQIAELYERLVARMEGNGHSGGSQRREPVAAAAAAAPAARSASARTNGRRAR